MPVPQDPELSLLVDRSPVGMYRANRAGVFAYVNAALARMLGYTVDELMTKNLNREVYADPKERERVIEKYLPASVVEGAEVEFRKKDGTTIAIQLWGHAIVVADGSTLFDASVHDISHVKRQRLDLERTAKILDLVVMQMPALYWVVDRDLRITRTGGAVQEVLGYAGDRFLGARLSAVHRFEPGSVDPVPYHERALQGDVLSYDTSYRGKQLAVTVAPYRQDGEIVGAIGTTLDVTASRALERRLVDAQRAESLGVLAGGLAHDFNNLLVAVIGNADLALRDLPRGMPGRAAVENIRDAGLRAAELTHQLLTFSGKAGAGTTRLAPAAVIEELLRIIGPTVPQEISVTTAVPADLSLRADPGQLRQVLLNLVANARDALVASGHARGEISIRGELIDHDGLPSGDDVMLAPGGRYVLIEVKDDGPGMDDETRRHVFEPFFTTKEHGHGIGLAAVLGIVRAHEGGLRLRTGYGRGATFQVLWPAAATQPGRAPTPPPTPSTRVVLVIDDEDLVRDVVARMIEDLGYGTMTAPDGAAGLALVDANPMAIDAVLVDMTMPRMSGRDVIEQLRARRPDLPIVVCSGFDRDGQGPVHADAYLPKPFRIDVLERTLAKLLPP
ncbi:MAG TPA: PAS domain S-box protein [Kofleriaceae bacterium]